MCAARLSAIKQHIAHHLTNPKLSTEQVSRKFGISARYISLLFAEEGTSFPGYGPASYLPSIEKTYGWATVMQMPS